MSRWMVREGEGVDYVFFLIGEMVVEMGRKGESGWDRLDPRDGGCTVGRGKIRFSFQLSLGAAAFSGFFQTRRENPPFFLGGSSWHGMGVGIIIQRYRRGLLSDPCSYNLRFLRCCVAVYRYGVVLVDVPKVVNSRQYLWSA